MFKKILSLFLTVVMLICVCSVGLMGLAATTIAEESYSELAALLKNNYVRQLTNYTIENKSFDNGNDGFNTEANGFAYDHRVIAKDNANGDIIKAANKFYIIAEDLMSYKYGTGAYTPDLLLAKISERLKPYFEEDTTRYFQDLYGDRYIPTNEEIKAYDDACADILATRIAEAQLAADEEQARRDAEDAALIEAGEEVPEREPIVLEYSEEFSLTDFTNYKIYFVERECYGFFNVDTVLRYFLGNNLKINAGNWFHRFSFMVETDMDTVLRDLCKNNDITKVKKTNVQVRTALYELTYTRTYDSTGTRARYAFNKPSIDRIVEDFKDEGITADMFEDLCTYDSDVLSPEQASALFTTYYEDDETIEKIQEVCEDYTYIVNSNSGTSWDARYATMTEAQIAANTNTAIMLNTFEELTSTYSNETLMAIFGDSLGDIVTLAYILKPISDSPKREVRDGVMYVADAQKLNGIANNIDALIYGEGDQAEISKKVVDILKLFPDLLAGILPDLDLNKVNSVADVVPILLESLLFNDALVNTLVELVYPLVVGLIEEKVIDAVKDAVGDSLSGTVSNLLDNIIENNDLALYPDVLADRINKDYPNKFTSTAAQLKAAGHYWENVDFENLKWGIDELTGSEKSERFLDALCAGLGGFMRLVVTVFCGDAEYTDNAGLSYDSDHYNEYYSKKLLTIIVTGYLRSQGGYTKLIVPLFRVLGIPEMTGVTASQIVNGAPITGYVNSRVYNAVMAEKQNGEYCYNYSLRLILAPIVYWASNVLAHNPISTILAVLPNLIHFLSRTGTGPTPLSTIRSNLQDEVIVDRTHGGAVDGVSQYEQIGTCNLTDILKSVYIIIDISLGSLKNWVVNIGDLYGLIGEGTLGMVKSVNDLIAELLSFETDNKNKITGYEEIAYKNASGTIVLADSEEYEANPGSYPTAIKHLYTNKDKTKFSEKATAECTELIEQPVYEKVAYKIPIIQEKKLTSTTTLDAGGNMVDPNAIGVIHEGWNTIDVKNPGVVFMYLLRFVLSALGYRYNENVDGLPILIECFGLELDNELFDGLNLKDIIYNVMLHPDAALCALLELLQTNEHGVEYSKKRVPYTYPLEPIDYHEKVLLDQNINPTLSYGNQIRYSKYWTREYAEDTIENLYPLALNVINMLGIDLGIDLSNGLSGFVKSFLAENVFNDDMMNTLFNLIYQLIAGLNDQLGMDLLGILKTVLGVDFNVHVVANTIVAMTGHSSEATDTLLKFDDWKSIFTSPTTLPVSETEEGGETPEADPEEMHDVDFDWGIDSSELPQYEFLKVASGMLAPAGFVFKFLFADQHLTPLGLIDINSYAGYQYAFIGLLETLSCPRESILTYDQYYEKAMIPADGNTIIGDANSIYYLLSPLLGLVDKICADPLTTVLSMIPHLLFFISIGGMNDLLNNLVHFVYVLLDILKPIVNGYDLLNGIISNLDVGGITINLSLPLDIDFNALISDLIAGLVGDSLEISGVKITLPYIDLQTLCSGQVEGVQSQEQRLVVHLDSAGGADLLTGILRLVFEVLFIPENQRAVKQLLVNLIGTNEDGTPKIDQFDQDTIQQVIDMLFTLLDKYQIPDLLLFVVYFLVTELTPLSGTLANLLKENDMTLMDVIGIISGIFAAEEEDPENPSELIPANLVNDILDKVKGLLKPADGEDDDPTHITIPEAGGTIIDQIQDIDKEASKLSFIQRLKNFFDKIRQFFNSLFGKKPTEAEPAEPTDATNTKAKKA